jgi:hypothetical protein
MASAGYATPPIAAVRVASKKSQGQAGAVKRIQERDLPKRTYEKVGVN